jgi:hypothetical protein
MKFNLRPWSMATLPLIVMMATLALGTIPVEAVDNPPSTPSGPNRFADVSQEYTSYEWWVTSWANNSVLCNMKIDHEGLPTNLEISAICGKTVYALWSATKPCKTGGVCTGYYLQFVRTAPATRKVKQALPPPTVTLTVDGCEPWNSSLRCDTLPELVFTAIEPLDGQTITSVDGTIDSTPFSCVSSCELDLTPTKAEGMSLDFWANSSYGDTSQLFHSQIRVAGSQDPDDLYWYVDVISSQWRGAPMAPCSLEWGAFPPIGGPQGWLSSPSQVEQLATDRSYGYLAAQLINRGAVDISSCADGGILDSGMASPCGMDAARPAVIDWQNRFDDVIFAAAQDPSVPGYLLKSIFGRESQFWPIQTNGKPEVGLGHMTDNGADTTLLWNHPFFTQFCPSVLDPASCTRGYANLQAVTQQRLRTALLASVNADCPTCALGIDMSKAEYSIPVFANLLKAECVQTGKIVYNSYGGSPGSYADYEDLWRFTLVNYNAGSGCLILAIRETQAADEPLDWQHLSSHLTPVCKPSRDYVSDLGTILTVSPP